MFYTARVVFIHIPRTAGTWLSKWAFENLGASVDDHYLKHMTYDKLIKVIPQIERLQPFTIIREEEDRFNSWFKHCKFFRGKRIETDEWNTFIEDVKDMTEEDFRSYCFPPVGEYISDGMLTFPYEKDLVKCIHWLTDVHRLTTQL